MKQSHRHQYLIRSLLLCAIVLINIELTAVNLAVADIAHAFSVKVSDASVLLTIYLAMFAVFSIVGGKLGDLYGRKLMSLIMLALFAFGSFLGGATHHFSLLLMARAIQGIAGGAGLPNYTALLYEDVEPNKKSTLIAIISATVGFSTSIGPLLGSFIIAHLNWRFIFYMNLPVCLIIFLVVLCCQNNHHNKHPNHQIDIVGLSFTVLGIVALMQLISTLTAGLSMTLVFWVLTFSAIFTGWVVWHRNQSDPFISIHLFKRSTYALTCFVRFFLGFSYYMILFMLGMYAQYVLHLHGTLAGLIYLPLTLSVAFASIAFSTLSRLVSLLRMLIMSVAVFIMALIYFSMSMNNVTPVIFILIVLGASYGILYTTLFQLTLNSVDKANTSEASGMLYFSNLVGGTLGVAITGLLLATHQSLGTALSIEVSMKDMLWICALLLTIPMAALCLMNKKFIRA